MPIPFVKRTRGRRAGIVTPPGVVRSQDTDGRPRPAARVMYASPEEAVDDPRRWGEESGYFGLAPEPAPAKPGWQAALEQIVPAAISLATQRQLSRIQLERTRQGLPPLSPAEIRAQLPPAARVEVGLPPFDWKALAIPGAIALGVVGFMLARRG